MRKIIKGPIPNILSVNQAQWSVDYLADPTNKTKKYRYRSKEIKAALIQETNAKCVYCESKVGHNTPGDVEHILPSSLVPQDHFNWVNLTIACTECNRRKNAYYDIVRPFIHPYIDAVESRITHLGPIASWPPGDAVAEISIRTLELNNGVRKQLIFRKIEKLEELSLLRERIASESNDTLKILLEKQLDRMKSPNSEYSAMVCKACA